MQHCQAATLSRPLVSLILYSKQSSGSVQTKNPLEIEINNINDLRAEKLRLGERTAAFGVKRGDIYPNRRMGEYLAETLSDALRAMGHKVGSSTNSVTIEGELLKFWVRTPATMLCWDVAVEMELKLLVKQSGQEPLDGRGYIPRKRQIARTHGPPPASLKM